MPQRYCGWCDAPSSTKWCSHRCKDLAFGKIEHTVRPSACIACATPITQPRKIRYYCSPNCNPNQNPATPPARPRVCRPCGRVFTPFSRDGRIKFCSNRCWRYRWRMYPVLAGPPEPYRYKTPAGPPPPVKCGICSRWRTSRRATYCDDACFSTFGRDKSSCLVFFPDCDECGGVFTARRLNARYCSHACQRRHHKRQRRYLRRTKSGSDLGVTLQAVARRDGWCCHICGGKTNRRYEGGRDRDPTIDHLIPVSAGGDHVWSNVALAHNRCNWERGATGPAQLLLVG